MPQPTAAEQAEKAGNLGNGVGIGVDVLFVMD